jgi:UDP-N-acetylmuramate dehydrogenase
MTNWQEFIDIIGQNRIKQNELISLQTNKKSSAFAKLYIEVERIDDLIKIVTEAKIHKIPTFIIGTGSWAKIPEGEINGLIIKNNCRRFDLFGIKGKIKEQHVGIDQKLVYAESGTNINQLVRFTIEEGLSGLEYQLGLPGTVGGAIYINARYSPKNIYVNDIIKKIKILNKKSEIQEVDSDYFISRSGTEFSEVGDIILSAIFRLIPEDRKLLWDRGNEAAAYRNELANKEKEFIPNS